MKEIKHIELIGTDGVGLSIAHIMAEEHKPIILVGQGQVGKTIFAQKEINASGLMKDIPLPMLPEVIDLGNCKTGRENRRERRKLERKNKKL